MSNSNEKKLWYRYGAKLEGKQVSFGPYYSYQWRRTPLHILFTLSRYKFALKMIGDDKRILELGCNEGFGSYFLSQFSESVHGVDFDERAILWAKENLQELNLTFENDDLLGKGYGIYDAVISFDVAEHIYQENERLFFQTLADNLKRYGVCLVGVPNVEAEKYSSPENRSAHVNLFSASKLRNALEMFFGRVFMFSQNDEVIHTGYAPMAHYLIALGVK